MVLPLSALFAAGHALFRVRGFKLLEIGAGQRRVFMYDRPGARPLTLKEAALHPFRHWRRDRFWALQDINLRLEPAKNNQAKGLRWARDYEFAARLTTFLGP